MLLILLLVSTNRLAQPSLDDGSFEIQPAGTYPLTFIYLFMVAASTAYRMTGDRMKADKLAKEKENENLKTELSLLRSQVSPHFMFNVLNNMVALARKKSDLLEPSLIKLSSLMRYMLYETDEEKVQLEREIEYLQSYIDLQKQRFGNNICVQASLNNTDGNYEIEPMLLIPFVENAFKHGGGHMDKPKIDIELSAHKQQLRFKVINRYNAESLEIKDRTSGIGLPNVQRRLNLLYGKKHSLQIDKQNGMYTVNLQINLAP
jgi:LytS/YehU family sensor histidine kinase